MGKKIMEAVKIKIRLDTKTIHLPGLRHMIGRNVEIIVLLESDISETNLYPPENKKRKPGSAKGIISVTEDFANPLDAEMAELFYR